MSDATQKLVDEARRWPEGEGATPSAPPSDIIRRLADALEAAQRPAVSPEVRGDLTAAEYGAASWAVLHLIQKHGYSAIVSPEGGRVKLEPLLDRLVFKSESQASESGGSK